MKKTRLKRVKNGFKYEQTLYLDYLRGFVIGFVCFLNLVIRVYYNPYFMLAWVKRIAEPVNCINITIH